jgi:hypothetical protein
MPCYSPLKGFRNKENGGIVFKRSSLAGEAMEVACGQCLGCRLDRSRMWAIRIVHESSMWPTNSFVTLTYDEEHMPRLWPNGPGTLLKKDVQKFLKRLRKHVYPRKVRYYYCGEYGDNLDRPHYHLCLFNMDFGEDKVLFSERDGNLLYTSETLEKIWGNGFCTVGELTFESAAYVSRYCLKKVTGKNHDDHYLRCDDYGVAFWLEPEYTSMSRRPGIGKDWYEEFSSDCFPSDDVPVPGSGVYKKVPRYYEKLLEQSDPELLEQVKEERKAFRLANADEYSPDRLMAKYKVKKAATAKLVRS